MTAPRAHLTCPGLGMMNRAAGVTVWRPPESGKYGYTPKGPARVGVVCPELGIRPVRPKGPAKWCDDWPRPTGARDPRQGEPHMINISCSDAAALRAMLCVGMPTAGTWGRANGAPPQPHSVVRPAMCGG